LCRRRLAATVIVECALQRSLGPNNNLAVYLSQRINAFSPLPFNAAVDAQRVYGKVNLADTLCVRISLRGDLLLSVNEVAETWKVPSNEDKCPNPDQLRLDHTMQQQRPLPLAS
jgi:hypothetical protein